MSFNKQWWDNFLITNKNFKKTCVIKNALNDIEIKEFNDAVRTALINKLNSNEKSGFRVYLPDVSGNKPNDQMKAEMFNTPISNDETIENYCTKLFKQKFGIILNKGERYSKYISEKLIEILKPLMDKVGMPVSGMHATIFIGNYGWTPLGIHKDKKGSNVIHFHLGPGGKVMYTWDEKKYEELTGTIQNNQVINPLLKYAEKFEFHSKDLYFMPWDQFHIGNSDEFSIGVTFWFNNPTKKDYFNRIFNSFFTQYIDLKNDEIIPPNINYKNDKSTYNDFLSIIKLDKNILDGSLRDFLHLLYDEYKKSLISNYGWENPPISIEKLEKLEIEDNNIFFESNIQGIMPFKILYEETNCNFKFYVRGYKMEIKKHKELPNIIDKLNSYKKYEINDLLKELNNDWPKEAGLYFLSMIYDKRGFELIKDKL